jgi:hypothetical protein
MVQRTRSHSQQKQVPSSTASTAEKQSTIGNFIRNSINCLALSKQTKGKNKSIQKTLPTTNGTSALSENNLLLVPTTLQHNATGRLRISKRKESELIQKTLPKPGSSLYPSINNVHS